MRSRFFSFKMIIIFGILLIQDGIPNGWSSDQNTAEVTGQIDSRKEEISEAERIKNAREAVRKRHSRKEYVQGGVALASILGGGGLTYLLSSNPALSLIAGSFILQRLQHDIPFLLSKLSPRGWFVSEKNEYQQLLFKLEEDYEVKKPFISKFNDQVIAKIMADTQSNIDSFTPGYTFLGNLIQTGFARLGALLSLPVKKINAQDSGEVLKTLNAHLATFDRSVQIEVSKLVFRMMTLAKNPDQEKLPKASYLFVGEAGTGKTSTAEAIAKSYGMPYCRINLGSIKLSELFGSIDRDSFVMGRLARCMIEPDSGSPGVNPLIFIDEIHDMLNSNHPDSNQLYTLLKALSDPDQVEIEDVGLGAKIDISQVTFIFGANARPDAQKDISNALNSRLISIEFPQLNADQKKIIAFRSFKPLCEKYNYSSVEKDDTVLNEILVNDREPGARILKKVIEDYVLHRAAQKEGSIDDGYFSVTDSYKRNGGRSFQ